MPADISTSMTWNLRKLPRNKRSWLLLAITGTAWTAAFGYTLTYVPRVSLNSANGVIFYIVLSSIGYFWIFSAYHFATFFLWMIRPKPRRSTVGYSSAAKVAVCYTVCNDFDQESVLSSLDLGYGNYKVFICDDSTDSSVREQIDAFLQVNGSWCALIRRHDRRYFKAGNLNNLLEVLGNQYDYLLLADSDSIITREFIPAALSEFHHDSGLAFVQACHRASPKSAQTGFGHALAPGIACMWRFALMKNSYGMPPMLGHGALLNLKRVREAGGFPHRISEDLALTIQLRALGYRGLVLDGAWCEEAVPATFPQYRRRFEKWTLGSIEFLLKDCCHTLGKTAIPLIERIDLTFNLAGLLNVLMLSVFLFVASILWPMVGGIRGTATIEFPTVHAAFHVPVVWIPLTELRPVSTAVRFLVIGATLASLVYYLPDFIFRPVRTLAHISNSFTCFCTMLVPLMLTVLMTILTGRYDPRITGDITERRLGSREQFASNFYVGRIGSLGIEGIVGLGACIVALFTFNLFLSAIAVGVVIAPLLDVLGWDFPVLALLRHAPFCLLCIQLLFVGFQFPGSAPMANGLVFIHF